MAIGRGAGSGGRPARMGPEPVRYGPRSVDPGGRGGEPTTMMPKRPDRRVMAAVPQRDGNLKDVPVVQPRLNHMTQQGDPLPNPMPGCEICMDVSTHGFSPGDFGRKSHKTF